MSEVDKAKEFAEREAQQHPQEVEKGEQAAERMVEKDLGLPQQGQKQSETGTQDHSAGQGGSP